MTPKELQQITDALTAALEPLNKFFTSVRFDGQALRTSEPFRIAREGGPTLAVTTTAAETDQLASGLYHITADTTGVFVAIGSSPTALVGGYDYRLVADGVFGPVEIKEGERISAIVASGTANLYYHRVR